MRSIFIHLAATTRDAVKVFLTKFSQTTESEEWRFPPGSPSPVLYIRFYDDLVAESERADLDVLKVALGQMPDVSVMADISGRVSGDVEARHFTETILEAFHGVAWDDFTNHCWTLEEIQTGTEASGHAFFDYEGWYRDKPRA